MPEAPHTPNTSTFQPEDEAKASPVRRFAPLAGVVALMGTIVVAGTALANTRTAPEIDPSAVTVEASVSAEETPERPTSTSATTTSRAHHDDDRYDDDWDDRDDRDDLDDRPSDISDQQAPAYITPQVPLTYQDWDDDDDDWDDDHDDDWDDDDWDDDHDDDWDDDD
ncbi:hypothetical protein, partial [Corynebacterium casei]